MTADTFLLSDTHHDESTDCQVKSILLHFIAGSALCGLARSGGSPRLPSFICVPAQYMGLA